MQKKLIIGLTAALLPLMSVAVGKPNFILILADDLGYGDLGCYNPQTEGDAPNNTPIKTPNLDRLAKNGARLTDFHSAGPICSPSRRALLTARYPSRLGEWAEAYNSSDDGVVAAKDPTIGMWLKQAGYATACYGKWNIGNVKDVSWPGAHGFDDWLIIDHNTGYFQHQNRNKDCQGREMLFETGGERVTSLRGKYLTDIWTDKALEFIDANRDKPFFLYLPFAVPHAPLQDPANPSLAFDEQPGKSTPEAREAYVKMVEYLDSRLGKIFQTLENHGLNDKTLIIFTSDNGGMTSANNWPLKKAKQWLEEGGIRVPCLMQWPGVIPPGTVSGQPSIMMDASVTMLTAADAMKNVPAERTLDGIDLLPVLQGKAQQVVGRVLGWRRRDWGNKSNYLRQEAYRQGDWKLLRSYKSAGRQTWSATHTDELFNLKDDVGEIEDLAQKMPEKYEAMKKAFTQWKQDVVEREPDYMIPVPDQLGSPAKPAVVAKKPIRIEPDPAARNAMLFDFNNGKFEGRFLTRDNEVRVSEPEIGNGIFKVRLSPGMTPPTPMIYRDAEVDTDGFSRMRVRMKVTVEDGSGCKPARAMLRSNGWKGKDLPFAVDADGEWHEYVIDVTKSVAWSGWTPKGRIGLGLPNPDKSPVTVEVDFVRLESGQNDIPAITQKSSEP